MICPPIIRGEPDPEKAWKFLKILVPIFIISSGLAYLLWPSEGENLSNIAGYTLIILGAISATLLIPITIASVFAVLKLFPRSWLKSKSDK